jgi:hypothetical protein
VHARPSAATLRRQERPGVATVMGVMSLMGIALGTVMVVTGLVETATDADARIDKTLTALLMIGVSAVFANGSFKGHAWVRTFYLFGTPLLMAIEVVLGENMLLRSGFSWPLFGLSAVLYVAFAS